MYIILRGSVDPGASVDPDEVAHNEPPHLDLHCLHIQLHVFSFFGCFQ